jgi:adenosylhomocysteine nucleosidase
LLVFVAAESREFDGVVARAERVVKLDWPLQFAARGFLNGREILMVAHGPGQLAGHAVDVVREREKNLDGLVSIGYCGALNPALKPCAIFVPSSLCHKENKLKHVLPVGHALACPVFSTQAASRTGSLLCIDHVAGTIEEKAELHRNGGDAVEMEAAFIEKRAQALGVPFYCFKVVTDTASESFPLDFNRMRDADGRFSRSKIVAAAFRNPFVIFPELIKLNKRCQLASKALGDFIADTRF